MTDTIEFDATVQKVQTLVDMGLRFSFDAPEKAIMQMAMLAECKRVGVVLRVVCTPIDQTDDAGTADSKKARPPIKSLRGG